MDSTGHVRGEVRKDGVDMAEIKPAGDVLRGVVEDRGQISRQRGEHLVQVIGAVLKVDGVGSKIARSTPRRSFVLPKVTVAGPNLASVLQEGDKSANIHVRSGAIWGIAVEDCNGGGLLDESNPGNYLLNAYCL